MLMLSAMFVEKRLLRMLSYQRREAQWLSEAMFMLLPTTKIIMTTPTSILSITSILPAGYSILLAAKRKRIFQKMCQEQHRN